MAKRWYPVIDYLECVECGKCGEKCLHGVFDTAKAPIPVVIHPENCIDHCHGCGDLCPQGAIVYVGMIRDGYRPMVRHGRLPVGVAVWHRKGMEKRLWR